MNYTGTNQDKYAFHFVGKTLRNGAPVPADGEWLTEPHTKICKYGLHASWCVSDALRYAPGSTLCLVEVEQIEEQQNDKLVCKRRRILARFDATELLRADARASALSVIHLWDAPPVVRQYLETGDKSLRHAAYAAANAYAAAANAAYAANAAAAAYAAANAAANAAYAAAAANANAYAAYAAAAANANAYAAYAAYAAAAKRKNSERLHNAVMAKFIEMGVLR